MNKFLTHETYKIKMQNIKTPSKTNTKAIKPHRYRNFISHIHESTRRIYTEQRPS